MTIYKTVHHGDLRINNVPHTPYPRGIGPDGEAVYLDGSVMYRLSHIIRRMTADGISECDYSEKGVE